MEEGRQDVGKEEVRWDVRDLVSLRMYFFCELLLTPPGLNSSC